jgi:metacaspase-1
MNLRQSWFQSALILLFVLGVVNAASAKDTALLITITYRNAPDPSLAKKTLPGTARDLIRMREVVQTLGFEDVRTLTDSLATYAGIRTALMDLSRSVKSSDRVLVYYSGHGTRIQDDNGDEEDGFDEALVPFDFSRAGLQPGQPGPSNLLRDDEFGELLRAIPSNRVFVLLDSCHSGTGTRAIDLGETPSDIQVRYFDAGVDLTASRAVEAVDDRLPKGAARDRFVNLMAAKDVETAKERSNTGGLFTSAFVDYVKQARDNTVCSAHLETMFSTIQAQVMRNADEMRRSQPELGAQTPQLEADDPALHNQVIAFKGVPGCQPRLTDRMQYWSDFAAAAKSTLEFKTNATEMQPHPDPDNRNRCASRVGLLSMELTAPADGYVTILNIGEGDSEATVVFPNGYAKENRVRKGQKLSVPPAGQTWCLPARLPAGRTSEEVLVIAVFSETPVNLFDTGTGTGPFREVGNGSRSFSTVAGRSAADPAAAAQTMVTIRK